MDEQIKTLLRQKIEALDRDLTSELRGGIDTLWEKVNPSPNCIWVGDLVREVRNACHQAIYQRGERVAAMLKDLLGNLKVPYDPALALELGELIVPFFAEDLHLALVTNISGLYQRRGNPVRFDQRVFENEFTLAKVGCINGARSACAKVQLVIDEYALATKAQTDEVSKSTNSVWDSVQLKPSFFGIGIDLKKLFTKKK